MRRPFDLFLQQHPDCDEETAGRRYRQAAYREWRRQQCRADPLPARLRRLRLLGYLRFSETERSLELGNRIRAWQARRVSATAGARP
jgi:hypothetical protein